MPFTQANAAQACTFMLPKSVANSVAKYYVVLALEPDEESEITRTGSMHNAEILSAARATDQK